MQNFNYSLSILFTALISVLGYCIFIGIGGSETESFAFIQYAEADAIFSYLGSVLCLFSGALSLELLVWQQGKGIATLISENTASSLQSVLKRLSRYFLPGSATLFVLIVWLAVAAGPDLISRNFYSLDYEPSSPIELILTAIEQPLGMAPAFLRLIRNEDLVSKWISRLALLGVVVYLVGEGTKFSAACMLAYAGAALVRDERFSLNSLAVICASGVVLVLTLGQRLYQIYGIASILSISSILFEDPAPAVTLALEVIVSPVFITAETLAYGSPLLSELLIELSPLGGQAAGWYEISESRRINAAVPMAGLATLSAFSAPVAMMYGSATATILLWLRSLLAVHLGKLAWHICLLLGSFQFFMLSQYNLRSATRWSYYFLALAIFLFSLQRVLQLMPQQHSSHEAS